MKIFRKNRSKWIVTALALAMLLTGCGRAAPAADDAADGLKIVTTIFPLYDWVRQIVGDTEGVQISMLMDSGVDLHNFQVTADDIIRVGSCDLFVYVGGASDGWVPDTLAQAVNKDMTALDLMDALGAGAKTEQTVEGMQPEEEEEEEEYDEHVWLSLKNAVFFCGVIAEKLEALDPDNARTYADNAAAYIERLNALDGEYQAAVDGAARRTLLFGDRFPFRYLADDYGLSYYAAFSGCSAESEASFETITFLAQKVDELALPVILCIESSDGSIPETIRNSTAEKNQTVLVMDSLQAKTARDIEAGASYLSCMQSNLDVLRTALN